MLQDRTPTQEFKGDSHNKGSTPILLEAPIWPTGGSDHVEMLEFVTWIVFTKERPGVRCVRLLVTLPKCNLQEAFLQRIRFFAMTGSRGRLDDGYRGRCIIDNAAMEVSADQDSLCRRTDECGGNDESVRSARCDNAWLLYRSIG